ncbi:SDR family NAD(P)-dependent oxidoreductase [Spartinivicinus marinus]|uniref:SDR family NAD(P)-dependent oxidoreductase n=1 Tax=Spartinivicinus marinus TaxID=2994442 RepID=UPI00224D3592|nr:SDR family NAD(P)-dependent oxidoreductase [Spartinivicinus marinus]MCX4028707.1 SDR family NAD(P)-dependent oxidoreductase [Spartinivicinus marinus]
MIIGAGQGLGRSLALKFAQEGHNIALMARKTQTIENIASDVMALNQKALCIAADVTDIGSITKSIQQTQSEWGTPDAVIYNAGALQPGTVIELTPEQFESLWKVNCMGAFLVANTILPAMIARGSGSFLLTGATASIRASAKVPGFAVGKFGLRALAQSMAREYGPQGIHVAHVLLDGMIGNAAPLIQSTKQNLRHMNPNAIAAEYWKLHQQHPTTWTSELDLRTAIEHF